MVYYFCTTLFMCRDVTPKIFKMNLIIKSAKIIDSKSTYHNSIKDILIENGRISKIEDFMNMDETFSAGFLDFPVQKRLVQMYAGRNNFR